MSLMRRLTDIHMFKNRLTIAQNKLNYKTQILDKVLPRLLVATILYSHLYYLQLITFYGCSIYYLFFTI